MSRILEISVEGAANLPNVRRGGRCMKKVFAKVSIIGRPDTEKKTTVDKKRGSNPTWNCQIKFTIEDILPTILFEIHCVCFAGRERLVGEVRVPVKDLADDRSVQIRCCRVIPVGEVDGTGEGQGELIFKYIFRQGTPSPPPEEGQPNQQENEHVPGRKRDFLKTVVAKIVGSAVVGTVGTVVVDALSEGF